MVTEPSPRVLLVDDERDFLHSLAQRLALRGLTTFAAPSGPEALRLLEQERVDVVVLDVRMPGMDGIETLRRIKEVHPRVEVVMLTGHADLESALEGMRFGFFDYLTKPVGIDDLITKIGQAMQRRSGEAVNGATTFEAKLKDHMIVADRLASLGELAASIAHEINNPLAIIAESAGWLRSRATSEGISREELESTLALALGKIDAAVERARRISQSFLGFARGPAKVVEDVDLRQLAAEVVELTAKTAANAGAQLEVAGDAQVVATDAFQLRQVLLNLVTNATQAVARGGHVVVELSGDHDQAIIAVVDDGVGIPEANLERIFEPFFTTKPDGQGTGLGLAVTRGILEKLGGRIQVRSAPGQGSTFSVVLPRR